MILCIALFAAIAVMQLIRWWQHYRLQRMHRRVVLKADPASATTNSLLLRWTAPYALWLTSAVLRIPWLARWRAADKFVTQLQLMVQGILLAVIVGSSVALLAPTARGLFGGATAGVVALLPWFDRWVMQRRRSHTIEREWARFLELLALALEAGMDLLTALARIFEQLPPSPLHTLLQQWYRDVRLGRRPETAWRHLAQEAGVSTIDVTVALLLQAMHFGTPLVDLLRTQAVVIREQQLRRAEFAGARASHTMLIPVVCCIMPAYFLLTFGGVLIRFFTGTWSGLW